MDRMSQKSRIWAEFPVEFRPVHPIWGAQAFFYAILRTRICAIFLYPNKHAKRIDNAFGVCYP